MMREKGTEFGAVIGYSSDKMGPLGITRCVPQEIMLFFHMVNPLATKLIRSRWLVTGFIILSFEPNLNSV